MLFILLLPSYVISLLDFILSPNGSTLKVTGNGSDAVVQTDISLHSSINKLTKIEFYNLLELSASCCQGIANLQSVILDSTIEIIKQSCFQNCISLTSISIPNKVQRIEAQTFGGCYNLAKLIIGSGLNFIDSNSFEGTNSLSYFEVSLDNLYFSTNSEHNFLLSKDGKIGYIAPAVGYEVIVPSSIVTIKNRFVNHIKTPSFKFLPDSNLTTVESNGFHKTSAPSISFPEGLRTIGKQVFFLSSIKYVFLPSSLTSVDAEVFGDAQSLSRVEIGQGSTALLDENGTIYSYNKDAIIFFPPSKDYLFIPKNVMNVQSSFVSSAVNLVTVEVEANHTKYASHYGILYEVKGVNSLDLVGFPGGLKNATIVENCTFMKNDVMNGVSVQYITILGSGLRIIGPGAISFSTIKRINFPDGLKEIQAYAFQICRELEGEFVFPSSLEKVDLFSFYSCGKMTKVDFGKCTNLKSIGESALRETGITEVIFPPNIESIGSYSFRECSYLKQVSFPSSLRSISQNAFDKCKNMSSIEFQGNNITVLDMYVFCGVNIAQIDIPDSIAEIRSFAVSYCYALVTVRFSENSRLTTLAPGAFSNCAEIKLIQFGSHLSDVRPGALSQMYKLTNISVFPQNERYQSYEGVLYTKQCQSVVAFPGGLVQGNIYKNASKIESQAFYECKNLEILEFGESKITSIGESTFLGCTALSTIQIPPTVDTLSKDAFAQCTKLETVIFEANSRLGKLGDGVFTGCTFLRSFEFGDGSNLQTVGKNAFKDCTNLVNFTTPHNVTTIEESAFSGCSSLINICLSPILRSIGVSSFSGCKSLSRLRVPPTVSSIGSSAFKDCTSLKMILVCNSTTTAPDDVFTNIDPNYILYASSELTSQMFAGLSAVRILDSDCNIPTRAFTDSNIHNQSLFFVACTTVIQEARTANEGE